MRIFKFTLFNIKFYLNRAPADQGYLRPTSDFGINDGAYRYSGKIVRSYILPNNKHNLAVAD